MAETIAARLAARVDDPSPGLRTDDAAWSWAEVVAESAARAPLLAAAGGHVGVLLENVPEFVFLLGGAALSGTVIVGINPTRRGDELARDIRHTDCRLVLTDRAQAALLDGLDLGVPTSWWSTTPPGPCRSMSIGGRASRRRSPRRTRCSC